MAPIGVRFKDSAGKVGGVHSYDSRTIAVKDKKKITVRYDNDKDVFMLQIPDYKVIRVTKNNARKLAEWIMRVVT